MDPMGNLNSEIAKPESFPWIILDVQLIHLYLVVFWTHILNLPPPTLGVNDDKVVDSRIFFNWGDKEPPPTWMSQQVSN